MPKSSNTPSAEAEPAVAGRLAGFRPRRAVRVCVLLAAVAAVSSGCAVEHAPAAASAQAQEAPPQARWENGAAETPGQSGGEREQAAAAAGAVRGVMPGAAAAATRLNPLTGLPADVSEPAMGKERPLMVMVNNHAAARPQSGLSQADVLFECLAEGEITRLVAFYEERHVSGMIGPVRSIRPYYIDLGRMFDAIEVHAGGSPDAYTRLSDERIDHLDEITNAGRYFWRESFRKSPHNLYTDMEHLRSGAAKLGVRTEAKRQPALVFAASAPAVGQGAAAPRLDVTFLLGSYVVSYNYDARSGAYRRLINGKPHTDLNDGSQLTAANVIVLGADHKVLDQEGRREVKLTGRGPALVFRQGKAVQAAWLRKDAADTFHLQAADGGSIALTPGRTHYLIVPNSPSFEAHVNY